MKAWTRSVASGAVAIAGIGVAVGSSMGGTVAQFISVAVVAVVVGFGWPHFLGIPAKKTNGAVVALAGVASAAAAAFVPGPEYLAWTPLAIAAGVMAAVVVQLIRGTGQSHRLESAFGTSAGVLLCGLGAGWIATARLTGAGSMLLVAAITTVVALLIGMIRWPDTIVGPLAIVFSGLAAPLAGLVFADITVLPATIAGVVIGAVLAAFRALNSTRPDRVAALGFVALGLAPAFAVGAIAYFMDRMLVV
ncbi:permease [Sinomonas sp. ASV486]|uniref:Permease n=1 Tax=Sinomonas puerhi TaxID=3238584 RepID=A0AB39KZU3_9MICC|nr:permease [Sinomonas sp. ASV486]MDQ4488715.1 permease [Sinomonas sp. ASV486]